MTNTELVLDPALSFGELEARLTALGFTRDSSVTAVTLPAIPDEAELAAWTRGGERLTYTFNPVVSLRAIAPVGISDRTRAQLITGLPVLDLPSIGQLLTETEPRRILLGLYAARAAGAGELALVVASLQAHPDRTISRAAASTLEAVRSARGSTPREQTLAVMQVLCRRAIPVLAALLGPEGAARVEAMRPRPEDYARVFRADVVERVRAAYENLWRTPPQLDRLVSGDVTLRVDAAPAGMLSDENELSRRFPGGYRAAAPYLLANRVWFVWRYLHGGAEAGMRYDGVVLLDDRWVWFPKPYVVLGELVQSTAS